MSTVAAQTETDTLYDVYSLSNTVSGEVDNDLMTATLAVQLEDKDAARLASKVNDTMRWAVTIMEDFSTITAKTRDYQTYPRYDTSQARRLIGWRASQTLQLDTDDFEAAGKAIQLLQERLQVQSIRLSAKPATRQRASDQLIEEGLAAFRKRAELIQTSMGSSSFRILDVNIQDNAGAVPMYEAASMDTMRSAYVSEPAIQGGTSQVTVQVFGRIQLQ
ncbi:MAG: SIMPL domain-containing protein [Granulosicoccus sp.]|nr:SIMPL domain-containing protein [Granulosicoccus sp.]